MDSIKRGDIYLVNFDPATGAEAKKIRPTVIVSNDINNAYSPIVSIAPITSKVTKIYSFEATTQVIRFTVQGSGLATLRS